MAAQAGPARPRPCGLHGSGDEGQAAVRGEGHASYLKGIELLGTEVLPQIRNELGHP